MWRNWCGKDQDSGITSTGSTLKASVPCDWWDFWLSRTMIKCHNTLHGNQNLIKATYNYNAIATRSDQIADTGSKQTMQEMCQLTGRCDTSSHPIAEQTIPLYCRSNLIQDRKRGRISPLRNILSWGPPLSRMIHRIQNMVSEWLQNGW